MELNKVKFYFNPARSRVEIPAASMNMLIANEVRDNADLYQKIFGVYGYMKLNSENNFVIHTMKGLPFMWQPMNGCNWDPTGALFTGKQEITPCKSKVNEEFCIDELFDGCFKHLLVWNGRGNAPQLTAEGTAAFNAMVDELANNAVRGARLLLTVGQVFKSGSVLFNENTPAEIRTLFLKTMGTCKGWVELLLATAASATKYAHLNQSSLLANGDFSGVTYTGNVLTLYDALVTGAKPQLQVALTQGGYAARGGNALFLVTSSIFMKLVAQKRTQDAAAAQNAPRITVEKFTTNGVSLDVYKIDSTYVIPLSEIAEIDMYLTGKLHLACLTVSGCINMGSAYAKMPEMGENGIGLSIEKESSLKGMGKYYFAAYNLFATAIADTDYISAAQRYTVPA